MVIIAIAAFIQIYLFWVYFIFLTISGIFSFIFCSGNISPIVPVHPKIISLGLIFFGKSSSSFCFSDKLNETKSAIFSKLLYPCFPVKQFAFLEFITIEKIFLAFEFRFHLIFSETIFDCV